MKHWVRFRASDDRVRFGLLQGANIVEYAGDMFGACSPTGSTPPSASCALLSPCQPSKIIGLWNNFHALGAKIGKAAPTHPLYFIKSPGSLAGPGDTIRRPSTYQGKIVFEGELGVVIGKVCREVTRGARRVITSLVIPASMT